MPASWQKTLHQCMAPPNLEIDEVETKNFRCTPADFMHNTSFLPNELTIKCNLEFLPASIPLKKHILAFLVFQFYFISYFLHFFLLKSLSLPWQPQLAGISSDNWCTIWSCPPKISKTSVRGELLNDTLILHICNMTNFQLLHCLPRSFFRILQLYASLFKR